MDVKDAVKKALSYVAEVFEEDRPENIGLEEVVLNDETNQWEITVGFSRPWDYPKPGVLTNMQPQHPKRRYKIVTIDNDSGEVKSIKIREIPDA